MSRKIIGWIVGLMSLAVIGLIVIQVYWLNSSIDLNKKQFDASVRAVLYEVKNKLEDFDEVQYTSTRLSLRKPQNKKFDIRKEFPKMDSLGHDFRRITNQMDIVDRIDVAVLDKYIKSEIESSNITLSYDYGIFSEIVQDFVIANGHYLTEVSSSVQASTGPLPNKRMDENLRQSEYSTKIFNAGYKYPGILVMHFPDRTSHIWKNALPALILTVLFICIILFAFIYSLNIIFRQKKLSEMKSDFINNMTHEFKTPIATISLASDSITSDKIISNKEKVTRFAKIIRQENQRMLGQVEKVLQMAQIEQNKIELNWVEVDVHRLILLAKENVELIVQNRGGTISLDLKAERSIIWSDQNHLSNVIHNLLDNANKYSPDPPDITILTKNVSQGIELTVADKGQGMSKEAKKHIFDKFFRVHTGNRHDVKGFGLGLSYVKAMVQAHKGYIRVRSELDEGSRFSLFFPFENEEK